MEKDIQLSKIGLGSWALGGGGWRMGWGAQDDKESERVILRALDLGINWIDTAPLYGFGHAERLLGKVLRQTSQKPLIATKCGIVWDSKRKVVHKLDSTSIRREIEDSLRRLKVDCIDIYFIHWPLPVTSICEAWETVCSLIGEGKVRYAGVSNFSSEEIEKISGISIPAFAQCEFNYLKIGAASDIIPYCQERGIKFIGYGVLNKGLLSGKYNHEAVNSLSCDDHRRKDKVFLAHLKNMKLCRIDGLTNSQSAIAWALAQPGVTSVICGMRNMEQVEENLLLLKNGNVKL